MNYHRKGEYITELEALKKAKKFFSRGYNQFNCPNIVEHNKYPKGLCEYYRELYNKQYISHTTKYLLTTDAITAVDDCHAKSKKYFRYNYFPKNSDRLNFLNSAIKSLTSK